MDRNGPYVGIDVSKDRLDGAFRPGGLFCERNDAAGIQSVLARIQRERVALVVVESTGGLELPLVEALAAAAVPVAVINPKRLRDFAKGVGYLAKNDQLDATVLAWYAEAVKPTARPLPLEANRALDALMTRRRQLVDIRTMELQRRSSTRDTTMRADVQTHIDWLDERIGEFDQQFAQRAGLLVCCAAVTRVIP
jgi:transposase